MSKDTKPRYSKNRVNNAGERVRTRNATIADFRVIENWRGSHNHVLNSWQATLRGRCKGKNIVFAQRLKRKVTIFDKLSRQDGMSLSRMHDIAGCRLIFKNMKQLNEYRNDLHQSRGIEHIRRKASQLPYPYDYITNPKPSGYRGIHDVYEYSARQNRDQSWNGLFVEIQYRTIYQHAWATAVEIAGSLTGSQSKFGRGDENQIEFFRLASEIIARYYENSFSCYPELLNKDLIRRFKVIENETHLLERLNKIKSISSDLSTKGKNLILFFSNNGSNNQILYRAFSSFAKAADKYFELENDLFSDELDMVLVRAESFKSIEDAFRNYFSDVKDFVSLLETGVKKLPT